MTKLYIDLETYSSVNIKTDGAYKYTESIDFEIIILCFAFNDEPIITVDLAQGEKMPRRFTDALRNPQVELHAHNATFERLAFRAIGWDIPIWRWHCTAVKSSYCGLPISLEGVSDALKLGDKGKLATGKALIRFFSCPIKPTKSNGMRVRNFPHHDLVKWNEYKGYCHNDVEAEREIDTILKPYAIPDFERELYILDQEINDRGILIDLEMARNATIINQRFAAELTQKLVEITGLDNPNSPAQLKQWLSDALGKDITTLAKENILNLLDETEAGEVEIDGPEDIPGGFIIKATQDLGHPVVNRVLKLRQMAAKTSIKKYFAMLACACYDDRAHGLFQFYGAGRTGRWAGRLIQMQNLPQNHLEYLEIVRDLVARGDYEALEMLHEDISKVLSQLIRTTFIAKPNYTFGVADFSAIEARITAWLADEKWRLDVFAGHGKIYEASASMMFGIPIEQIKKGSPERDKGKVAELALGYGGALGALRKMGGEKMGLSDPEMEEIVRKWRAANVSIVKMWKAVENAAIQAVKTGNKVTLNKYKNLIFEYDGFVLTIQLPSGRKLFYQRPQLKTNKWGKSALQYKGMDQVTKKWWWVDTYGGKLIENIIQAIARDCLAYSMVNLNTAGFDLVLHVHDESVAEVELETSEQSLKEMCNIMGQPIDWAPGLILTADGYLTQFYKKD